MSGAVSCLRAQRSWAVGGCNGFVVGLANEEEAYGCGCWAGRMGRRGGVLVVELEDSTSGYLQVRQKIIRRTKENVNDVCYEFER